MTTYRKKTGSNAWHWCTNCSNWPIEDYDEITLPDNERPSDGELCNQCKAKKEAGNCSK